MNILGISAFDHDAWVASRLGAAIRQLGAKGFGQVGKINDQYVGRRSSR